MRNAECITSRAVLLRAALRRGGDAPSKAREVLDGVATITIIEALLNTAGTSQPPPLRTLDALHLATALELGGELTAFVAYDGRLLQSAKLAGFPVRTPR